MTKHNSMKKIISIAILALVCNIAFAQTNIDAIYDKAESLINTGNSYYDDFKYSKALEYYKQAADLTKNIDNGYDEYYAYSLNNIGSAYYSLGDYQNALKYWKQEMEIKEAIYGINDPQYASALNNVSIACIQLGDNKTALKYLLQSVKIKEKNLGKYDISLANAWINISAIYHSFGDYENAKNCSLLAAEIRKRALGENHPQYAVALNGLGGIYYTLGDNQNALKCYTQSMEICKKALGENHPDYAQALFGLGEVYSSTGEYQNALKYLTQALKIYKEKLGEDHPDYAHTLNLIGITYSRMDDKQTALKYFVQALDIKEKIYGLEHPQYAETLNNIGTICTDLGQYQNALKFFMQAMKITKKNNGIYASELNNIGNVYFKMDEYSNALNYYTQAKDMWKKYYGETSSYHSMALKNMGAAYSNMGDYHNAILTNKQATEIFRNNLISNFSFMTAHERESFWNSCEDYFYETRNYLYYASDDTIATKIAYDSELVSKGLLLASEISTTNIIKESGNSTLISEYEDMKKMHQQLNNELGKPIEERSFDCDSLENELQKKERHIMESCKEYGDATRFISIGWKDIQKSMKNNDVAIEFTNVTTKGTTQFMALVLTKNMKAPVCLHLFEKSEMQKLQRGVAPTKNDTPSTDENRGATTVTTKRQGIYESTGLYNMLWKPLEKYFPENPRIYFAPSGMLHQIAIEYAPTGDGKLISDKYEIYRVSSTRFLTLDYMPMQMKNTVLYGGIYYDSDTTTMKRESNRYATRSANYTTFAAFNKDEERGSLNYLPGTKTEVEDIASKMKNKQITTTLYEGTQANEESFKALSGKSISTLHIATHGFFLPTEEKLSGDNSLIQSGLLMSGANYAWQNLPIPDGIEDGVLTAKEISYMDLRKTDLVVLSACQTALGEITGEGVFGLQRGFKKAGVHTIIMSLWPVDDNATLLMMTEFYSNLTKGMTKREAFLAAQNKVKNTDGFGNPRYWAAFIMLDGNEN